MTQTSSANNGVRPVQLRDSDWYQLLASTRRRRVLEILSNRSQPITVTDLATEVAAAETEQPLIDISPEESGEVEQTLRHVHLPKLAEADIVTETDGAITTTQLTDRQTQRIQLLLGTDTDDWDAVCDALAHERRRTVLRVLSEHGEPMDRSTLAAEVAVSSQSDDHTQIATDPIEVELHHRHLPKLVESKLISYDRSEETVQYEGHPSLPVESLQTGLTQIFSAILPVATRSADIWRITGREDVVAQGQSLIDEAETELFLMITTDGLLEETCILKLQAAIDRDVDVYIGSQTRSVRDLVRERLPDAVIWEPQLDWLNLPPKQETVGRLLLADRNAIMIGTLGEESTDGIPEETALTGLGQNNPLVMLLREVLGSRLDHLDEQSENFRSQIPL